MKTPAPYVAYFAVLVGLCLWIGYEFGRKSQPPAAVEVAHDNTVHAESLAARIDTVVQAKTKTLAKTITETLEKLDTVTLTDHLTDTVYVKDLAAQCSDLLHACEDYRASAIEKFKADSDVFRAKDREIAALLAARPSKLGQFTKYALTGLAGYAVGRLGVSVSLPFGH